jgi:hypothetical protein
MVLLNEAQIDGFVFVIMTISGSRSIHATKRKIMRQKYTVLISIAAGLAWLLSACGAGAQPTPDVAAISTVAAQTVEARFTQQAVAFTATPQPPTETPMPEATATLEATPTGQPVAGGNGKACYAMTFVADLTIPDGMIVAPGATFTKSWRVRNDGNCVWDQKYSLVLDKGDALSTVKNFPLTRVINPGDSLDLSIPMTAPTTPGDYAGYWHIATPFGGFMGVGSFNQSLIVAIKVSAKPDRDFGIASVVYDWNRQPQRGCGSDGAVYNFTATITANGPGEIDYRWDRNPFDGQVVSGSLKFPAAGSKTVYWTWSLHNGQIQDIDRTVWITTIIGTQETKWDRVMFNFTCTK